MDQKRIPGSAPIYPHNDEGFIAPPAYEQHQNYPQQIQGAPQGYFPPQQQIVTGNMMKYASISSLIN